MLEIINDLVLDNWSNWFQTPTPKAFDFVKIAGNPLPEGRVIFLLFADRAKEPCLVVKTSRKDLFDEKLAYEYKILNELQDLIEATPDIPRPLWFGEYQGEIFYIESALVGTLMGNMRRTWLSYSSQASKTVADHFHRAMRWLIDFQCQTTTEYSTFNPSDSGRDMILKMLNLDFPEQCDSDPLYEAKEKLTRFFTDSLSGQEVRMVCEHGDYWAGNIYLRGNEGIGVIDWGDAALNRLPLYDAPFFLVGYGFGFSLNGNNQLKVFEDILEEKTWYASLVMDALDDYRIRIGLPDSIDSMSLIGYALLRRSIVERCRSLNSSTFENMLKRWLQVSAI
jgi:hypothetical protein